MSAEDQLYSDILQWLQTSFKTVLGARTKQMVLDTTNAPSFIAACYHLANLMTLMPEKLPVYLESFAMTTTAVLLPEYC